jgi:hypothetical protein
MRDLLRLYGRIALMRSGPQEVPASTFLLVVTAMAYLLARSCANWVLPTFEGPWLAAFAFDILFTLCWYALLMRVVRKPERFLQTATAVFGFRAIVSPLALASGGLIRRFGEDAASPWQLPLWGLYLALFVWLIAASSHVLKSALEWSVPACVGLVILEILSNELLQISLLPIPH